MSKTSQKEAVVNEVKAILGASFDPSTPAKSQLTSEQLATIKSNIVDGIMNDTISFSKDTDDRKEVVKYVAGMVSNHFRKAKELNGGTTYSPTSTGKGSRDTQISELNKLLKTFSEGSDEYNQVVSAIAARKEELASIKAEQQKERLKQKELASINMDAIPENLKGLANSLLEENTPS